MRKELTDNEAMVRLEDLCARAERCTHELRQKLYGWRITGARADAIINSLVDRRFVDDERFARAFVNDRVRFQRRGRLIIRRDLMVKRVPAAIIDAALAAIDEDTYSDNLIHTLRVKLRAMGSETLSDPMARQKLLRHAVSRGYEPSLAAAAIRSLKEGSEC